MAIQPSGNDSYGALSGSGQDVVGDEIRRSLHDHEGLRAKDGLDSGGFSRTGGALKYLLAAGAFVVVVFGIFFLLFRGSDKRSTPALWRGGETHSSVIICQHEAVVSRLGDRISLTEHAPGLWQIAENGSGSKTIEYDSLVSYYQCMTDGIWFWYQENEAHGKWQCWYGPISGNYGDYGWMEYRDGLWYLEQTEGEWIALPEKYDPTPLWYILADTSDAKQ